MAGINQKCLAEVFEERQRSLCCYSLHAAARCYRNDSSPCMASPAAAADAACVASIMI